MNITGLNEVAPDSFDGYPALSEFMFRLKGAFACRNSRPTQKFPDRLYFISVEIDKERDRVLVYESLDGVLKKVDETIDYGIHGRPHQAIREGKWIVYCSGAGAKPLFRRLG
jgi:hypothetical protein